ncbi:hypothetical protein tb265_08350 [Gemmatimonadetes bacterium T265]|nr:hypothetical protein tb265_08350 [Gemmatimonadetes bacterium T265]
MRRPTAAACALALAACTHTPRADAAVQGAAVRELFFTREHARQLVLWTDRNEPGPTFDVIGEHDAHPDVVAVATAVPTSVVPVHAADLARLFRTHPDGWAAFYTAYPGSPGLVELARPAWSGDTLATVVVGRACGEHCLNAWRVTVRDGRVVATAPLRVPKS